MTEFNANHDKSSQQIINRKERLHLIKDIYRKPTANTILNGDIYIIGTKRECLSSPILFNVLLHGSPCQSVKQKERTKNIRHTDRKKEVQLS